jgi:hypothetical protein
LQALTLLYQRTGRDGECARLLARITPDVTDSATGGPLPGREEQWTIVLGERARLARQARDWQTAIDLQKASIVWHLKEAVSALAAPAASLTPLQRRQIRNLAAALHNLGAVQLLQLDPICLDLFQEALALCQRVDDRAGEVLVAASLGTAFLQLPDLRDLDQAEYWQRHSLSMRPGGDLYGRAVNLSSLGDVALERCRCAFDGGQAEAVRLEQLSAAAACYQEALNLFPADDHQNRAIVELQLGTLYGFADQPAPALRHYQQALQHQEARQDIYEAGVTRQRIALLLASVALVTEGYRVTSQALLFARAALANFQQTGAASDAARTQEFIAKLEQPSH